jgi:hypothetical protein
MPDLSVVKVSRSSGKGQIEMSGKQRGKTNGKDKKSELLKNARQKNVGEAREQLRFPQRAFRSGTR